MTPARAAARGRRLGGDARPPALHRGLRGLGERLDAADVLDALLFGAVMRGWPRWAP